MARPRLLMTMGTAWFISYSYYIYCDSTHLNWKNAGEIKARINAFKRSTEHHFEWIDAFLEKHSDAVGNNTIDLSTEEIEELAKKILDTPLKERELNAAKNL